jgi:hypothetical protein
VKVRVVVRVEVLVLEGDKNEADGADRERDSGGRWEMEQRGRERNGSTGECFGGAVAEVEGVGMRDRYCTQED